jgi:DNA-binding NarL/FixJ family response regulator
MESLARGQLMFALSAAFCVYLLITPALQLWRTRRSTYEDLDPCAMTKVEDIQDRCDALATRHGLSRREHEILRYLSQGYNAPYIASALVISESTVRSHTKNIYHKLGVSSRMELLEMAQKGSISNA